MDNYRKGITYTEDGEIGIVQTQKDIEKVFLIGDSMREGYCPYVKEYLANHYEVLYPNDNCRNTQYVLTSLKSWTNMFDDLNKVKVVCFNCGHWDIAHWNAEAENLTTESDYARNLKRIVRQLHSFFPLAKLVFFTSTPINESYSGVMVNPRTNKEVERYNKIAIDALKDEVIVKDMYYFIKAFGESCYKDYAHLTEEYCKTLGRYVADIILEMNLNKKEGK